jgi:two-component system, NarL family, sensor kinase
MDNLSEQVILIIVASLFLLVVAGGIILLVYVYQRKQLLSLKEKEQLKIDFEKQILESKLEMQEQTMKNISQEIHDNIGQVLSLAKLTINTMNVNNPDALKEKISNSKELIAKAIQDLRNLSKTLNTDNIGDLGLLRTIEYELELLKKASSYQIELYSEGEAYRLEHKQELIIFRIFQEAIQNIIKHSHASHILVNFQYAPSHFELKISDDGAGFDMRLNGNHKRELGGGMGLRNIDYRARLIAADCSIESHPGKGTIIKIKLPLQS